MSDIMYLSSSLCLRASEIRFQQGNVILTTLSTVILMLMGGFNHSSFHFQTSL